MKALALVEAPNHVCCRYRIRAFEPALRRAGWSLDYMGIARGALRRFAQLTNLPPCDTILLQRKLLPDWQLRILRGKARRLVFDFDDAILYRDSYDPRGPQSGRRAERFAATVRAADLVIAGNDFLADCALRAGAGVDRVQVIPTCIEMADYPEDEPKPEIQPGRLDLVWIGSSSTLRGIESQAELWDGLARRVPGVRLRVICDRFPRFQAMPVVAIPWSRTTEARELAAGSVGVSWIPDDLWSRGKCGLKLLQYQAAGLPVLANPVGVHPEMVERGINGWLPSGLDEWSAAVLALRDEPGLPRHMGRAARGFVAANYSVDAWSPTFARAISGSPEVPAPTFATRTRRGARPRTRTPEAQG